MRFENPPQRGLMNLAFAIWGVVFLVGLILAFSKGPKMSLTVFVAAAILGSIVPITFWLREYFFKPTVVDIREDGFILEFRYRKPINAQWSNLIGIYITPDSISENLPYGLGAIILDRGFMRHTTATIAEELSSRYEMNMGKSLETIWPEEGSVGFRRRIGRRG